MLSDMLVFLFVIAVFAAIAGGVLFFAQRAEAKRVNDIRAHQGEWGQGMCQWLIESNYRVSDPRVMGIMSKFQPWGPETCQKLLQKTIAIGHTDEMVRLALGNPTSMDDHTITEKDEKIRWIYGVPRQGAVYIWFKNGKVTKIKQ